MDTDSRSRETTAEMEPRQLKEFVDDWEVKKFLAGNPVAARIADDLQEHNVQTIEVEVWKRIVNGITENYPAMIFTLDNIEKLFEINEDARQAFQQRSTEHESVNNPTSTNGVNGTQQATLKSSQAEPKVDKKRKREEDEAGKAEGRKERICAKLEAAAGLLDKVEGSNLEAELLNETTRSDEETSREADGVGVEDQALPPPAKTFQFTNTQPATTSTTALTMFGGPDIEAGMEYLQMRADEALQMQIDTSDSRLSTHTATTTAGMDELPEIKAYKEQLRKDFEYKLQARIECQLEYIKSHPQEITNVLKAAKRPEVKAYKEGLKKKMEEAIRKHKYEQVAKPLSVEELEEVKAYKEKVQREASEALQKHIGTLNATAVQANTLLSLDMNELPEIQQFKEQLLKKSEEERQGQLAYIMCHPEEFTSFTPATNSELEAYKEDLGKRVEERVKKQVQYLVQERIANIMEELPGVQAYKEKVQKDANEALQKHIDNFNVLQALSNAPEAGELPWIKAYKQHLREECYKKFEERLFPQSCIGSSAATAPNTEDNPEMRDFKQRLGQELAGYKARYKKASILNEANKKVKNHIDSLDQALKSFMTAQQESFEKLVEENFEVFHIVVDDKERHAKLTKSAAVKLYGKVGRVQQEYQTLCGQALKDYKLDLKAQCQKHLADIETECRAVIRKGFEGKTKIKVEQSLEAVITSAKQRKFKYKLPSKYDEPTRQRPTEDTFREEIQETIRNFEPHVSNMSEAAKKLFKDLHKPLPIAGVSLVLAKDQDSNQASINHVATEGPAHLDGLVMPAEFSSHESKDMPKDSLHELRNTDTNSQIPNQECARSQNSGCSRTTNPLTKSEEQSAQGDMLERRKANINPVRKTDWFNPEIYEAGHSHRRITSISMPFDQPAAVSATITSNAPPIVPFLRPKPNVKSVLNGNKKVPAAVPTLTPAKNWYREYVPLKTAASVSFLADVFVEPSPNVLQDAESMDVDIFDSGAEQRESRRNNGAKGTVTEVQSNSSKATEISSTQQEAVAREINMAAAPTGPRGQGRAPSSIQRQAPAPKLRVADARRGRSLVREPEGSSIRGMHPQVAGISPSRLKDEGRLSQVQWLEQGRVNGVTPKNGTARARFAAQLEAVNSFNPTKLSFVSNTPICVDGGYQGSVSEPQPTSKGQLQEPRLATVTLHNGLISLLPLSTKARNLEKRREHIDAADLLTFNPVKTIQKVKYIERAEAIRALDASNPGVDLSSLPSEEKLDELRKELADLHPKPAPKSKLKSSTERPVYDTEEEVLNPMNASLHSQEPLFRPKFEEKEQEQLPFLSALDNDLFATKPLCITNPHLGDVKVFKPPKAKPLSQLPLKVENYGSQSQEHSQPTEKRGNRAVTSWQERLKRMQEMGGPIDAAELNLPNNTQALRRDEIGPYVQKVAAIRGLITRGVLVINLPKLPSPEELSDLLAEVIGKRRYKMQEPVVQQALRPTSPAPPSMPRMCKHYEDESQEQASESLTPNPKSRKEPKQKGDSYRPVLHSSEERAKFVNMRREQEVLLASSIQQPRIKTHTELKLEGQFVGRSISEILGARKRKRDVEDNGKLDSLTRIGNGAMRADDSTGSHVTQSTSLSGVVENRAVPKLISLGEYGPAMFKRPGSGLPSAAVSVRTPAVFSLAPAASPVVVSMAEKFQTLAQLMSTDEGRATAIAFYNERKNLSATSSGVGETGNADLVENEDTMVVKEGGGDIGASEDIVEEGIGGVRAQKTTQFGAHGGEDIDELYISQMIAEDVAKTEEQVGDNRGRDVSRKGSVDDGVGTNFPYGVEEDGTGRW
ncbi:uncharacterized protein PAC_01004 [Phialocephala subalpina]|uniref:Uncharacterized protein n=1 Tax=Phialocephala subalpina TaxID=576137 RepID=A0A1L7WEI3_9HELO|nr:uncharacterized protein PAC_01004 [Phialocephala subalpina]